MTTAVSAEEEPAALSEAQVSALYAMGIIGHDTWSLVLRRLRGDTSSASFYALRTCEVAIESLVDRAVRAARAVIQDRLGVRADDLVAGVFVDLEVDGSIERELTRFVHAVLAAAEGAAPGGTP